MNIVQLRTIMPYATGRVPTFVDPLNKAMTQFGIFTPKRQAAFLAQVAHESGELRYTLELASGEAYEGRHDLGNNVPGDGKRYKGRGLIQLTGRTNYTVCGAALGLDLVANPSLLETPDPAARSAGWFWKSRGLNELADLDKFGEITRKVNGGFNGLDDRIAYWLRARKVLSI